VLNKIIEAIIKIGNADFASSKVTDRSSLSSFEFLFSSSIINAAFSGEVLAVNPLCDGFWVCRIFGCNTKYMSIHFWID
jgi:hypothetical protein